MAVPNSGANTNGKMGRAPKKKKISFVFAGYVSSDGASLGLSKGRTGPGLMAKTDCIMAVTDEVVSSDVKHAQSQLFGSIRRRKQTFNERFGNLVF